MVDAQTRLDNPGRIMNLKMHIGLRVKAARQQAGLTQEALAETVGKATETISNIERGFALTGLDTLQRISEAVGSPMTYFFEGVGEGREASQRRLEKELQLLTEAQALEEKDLDVVISLSKLLNERGR
ncbi:helix-turn-helix domain-containing protein [Nitrospirillum pindoramense]|uniref:DNA-binding XRE family transcriptional regulator n=1 Tax=Nitrospirillum amazonense TaxID=28077 RepID=A0A560HJW1_9PROT|nr:helix-turn-helix transcriptional regulator [Nitrospirillum amazonense]TWB45490.1 DNA-binding XRE family transcriptional regulator [Nitrospirillum amazonense]